MGKDVGWGINHRPRVRQAGCPTHGGSARKEEGGTLPGRVLAVGAQAPCHKAKLFFGGKEHERTVLPAAPGPALIPHCTLRGSTAPSVAPLQEGVPSSRTARKEGYVHVCSLFSGLVWWVEGPDHSEAC